MRLIVCTIGIILPFFVIGQIDSKKRTLDSTFIKYNTHSDPPRAKISSVVVLHSPKAPKAYSAFFYQNSDMSLIAKGKINSQNKKVGKWKYYSKNGRLLGITHFSKEGLKIGNWKYYSSDGKLEKIIFIKKEKFGILKSKNNIKSKISLAEIKEPLILSALEYPNKK